MMAVILKGMGGWVKVAYQVQGGDDLPLAFGQRDAGGLPVGVFQQPFHAAQAEAFLEKG
jgi:hypothetical protein